MTDKDKDPIEEAQAELEAKREALGIDPKPESEPQIPTTHIGYSGTSKGHAVDSQDTHEGPVTQGQYFGWEVGISKSQALAELEQHRVPTESIDAFIWAAVDRNNEVFWNRKLDVELAGKSATSKRDHWSPCFTLSGILRGHPELKHLSAAELDRVVDEVIGEDGWGRLPDRNVWGDPMNPSDDLIRCWRKGVKPFYLVLEPEKAMPLVESYPLTCGDWPGDRHANYRRIVSLCFWYSLLLNNDGEFFLSCRTAETLMGFTYRLANEYLERAEKDDHLIVCLKKGRLVRGKKNEASEFRFNHDRVTFASD